MGIGVPLTLRDMFGGVRTQVPSEVTCGKRSEAAGREAGLYQTEAGGRDGAQVTRTAWDYANCRTRTNWYKCTCQNQYLTLCHQTS